MAEAYVTLYKHDLSCSPQHCTDIHVSALGPVSTTPDYRSPWRLIASTGCVWARCWNEQEHSRASTSDCETTAWMILLRSFTTTEARSIRVITTGPPFAPCAGSNTGSGTLDHARVPASATHESQTMSVCCLFRTKPRLLILSPMCLSLSLDCNTPSQTSWQNCRCRISGQTSFRVCMQSSKIANRARWTRSL